MTDRLLTPNEERVLRIIRRQCRLGDPVATATVRSQSRPIYPENVDRALRGLLSLDLIERPSRGFYLPKET